jgi:GAF domain-containing protein
MVELGGARSYVAFALRRQDGALLGTLAAYRQEVRPFSGKEIALLESFAAQAVVAKDGIRRAATLGRTSRLRTDP